TVDNEHRFAGITANPVIPTVPEMSVLSTSVRRAQMAAKLGIGYTLGLFPIADENKYNIGMHATETYRDEFKPSKFISHPTAYTATYVVVTETDEEAEAYAETVDFWLLAKDNFSYYPTFPSVKRAREYNYTKEEKETLQTNRFRMVVGDMESVKNQINYMITQFNADEVLFVPLMPGFKARKRAIELLAKAFI